jgi:uncharacterized protein
VIVRPASIPMPDGVGLAATLYLPDDADHEPVPALLEYLPYRKDDAMLARDHDLYGYLAERGYAGARVDIRGTGRSGGTLPEGEYTETEQQDAETVIAWLAAQPWCTGAVGMWGGSSPPTSGTRTRGASRSTPGHWLKTPRSSGPPG